MAAENQYVQAARQRWPRWPISGEGEFAVVDLITGSVALFDFRMSAQIEVNKSPSTRSLAVVKPAEIPTRRFFRKNTMLDDERF